MTRRAIATWAMGLVVLLALLAAATATGVIPAPVQAPGMAGDHAALSSLTLPVVLGAGLIDGFNPCAFAVLLVFIAATLAMLQQRGGEETKHARRTMLGMGGVYISGVFATYLVLGLGLLSAASFFSRTHAVSRIAALAAVLLGLLLLKEALLPELGALLTVPARLHTTLRQWGQRTTVPALFGAGVLVGLCTVPCSGAIYLAVLALLAAQTTRVEGYGYLVLYNIAFVMPLVVILVAATNRPLLNRLGRWQLHHRAGLKIVLGGVTILLGLGILLVS